MALPVYVRKAHRIIATLWLLFALLAVGVTVAGVEVPTVLFTVVGILILVLAITGTHMLVRPWIQRYRTR